MKSYIALAVCLGVLTSIAAIPRPDLKEQIEIVPLESNPYGGQPIIDTPAGGTFGNPFASNPFDNLFGNLEGLMRRMRQQLESILKRFPTRPSNSSSEEIPDFPIGGFPRLPFGDIDLPKGNTTSVTKIIDGHKVVINETEYKKEDDFGGTFFKVRVIDVKPDSSEVTTEKEAEEVTTGAAVTAVSGGSDKEPLANSIENEIPKSSEVSGFENLESFDMSDGPIVSSPIAHEWENIETVENIETNEIPEQIPVDLSRDIYVNQLLANRGAPINPDAEIIAQNNVPFDLSRDIYVNQVLANQGAPINPDAEIIPIDTNKIRPRFIDPR